jgi:hypothetical protein
LDDPNGRRGGQEGVEKTISYDVCFLFLITGVCSQALLCCYNSASVGFSGCVPHKRQEGKEEAKP